MSLNTSLYEKEHEAHYRDLRREAEKERMLAHLPRYRRSRSRAAVGKLGVLLLKLGAGLKRFEQAYPEMEQGSVVSARKEPFQDFRLHLTSSALRIETRRTREETDALRSSGARTPGPELV